MSTFRNMILAGALALPGCGDREPQDLSYKTLKAPKEGITLLLTELSHTDFNGKSLDDWIDSLPIDPEKRSGLKTKDIVQRIRIALDKGDYTIVQSGLNTLKDNMWKLYDTLDPNREADISDNSDANIASDLAVSVRRVAQAVEDARRYEELQKGNTPPR